MSFPASVPVKEIKETSKAYNAEKITNYTALYEGGDIFTEQIENFLVKRKAEKNGQSADYECRKHRAPYINHAGGLIDWLTAAVFKDEPAFVVDENASEQTKAYWEGLNEDANGLGWNLSAVAREGLRQVLLHGRSYLSVDFPSDEGSVADRNSLDAYIKNLRAIEVDDWHEKDGKLEWVRLHNAEQVRDREKLWSQSNKVRHTWTYYQDNTIVMYEAYENGSGTFDSEEANKVYEVNHDFNMPVFDVNVTPGQWVMERIRDVVVAIFNRDAAVCKYLDDSAFQMFVLKLNGARKMSGLIMEDITGLMLEIGEDAEWKAPQSGFYEPMHKDQKLARMQSGRHHKAVSMSRCTKTKLI